ncbi:hypothetical protein [Paenibacillus sp. Soil522]|uniref:hypothetical protein n=1 Tax=Paenibacillus sp. Soil522 TaxID=1736388 RepID=UPI0006FE8EB1|nr:hypothetical protein [Paenibacillus sp. Soil522]KRE40932.1 hypothetical protein ASG81_16990 [Paenibacillus sp. Soil522]
MRYLKFGILIGLMFLILVGCSNEVTGDEKIAEQYVRAQGYNVTSYKGEVNRYSLDKRKLFGNTESIPFQQAWGVQKVEPDKYFGKEVTIYAFTVSNHPLEKIYKAKSNVYIMLSEGKVIGGYSFPDVDGMVGGYYSLDGKTLEEVTGLSYIEWSDNWKKKYGDSLN